MWLLDRLLRRLIKRGELRITDHNGKTYCYGRPEPALRPVAMRFTDRRVAGEIARDPSLAAGEAYMDGRLLIEQGDIRDLVLLVCSNSDWEGNYLDGSAGRLARMLGAAIGKARQLNGRRRARRNAEHAYNIAPRVFELMLDEDRQYSCAYFTDPGNTLEQAQREKKAHIAAKLYLQPGLKVLDIGCGWGGLALSLNRDYGVEVLGVSLASEQIAVCRDRAAAAGVADKVRFALADYRDLDGTFDRIVSVGMFEHVGTPNYPVFFAKCRELMTPDGVMLLHTIGRMTGPSYTDSFIAKYIFPGGYIPALSEIVQVTEQQRLIASDVENLRHHYGFTLREWYRRSEAARDEIVAIAGERFYRMWQFYLAGSEAAFSHGPMVNFQLQLLKDRSAVPITRDYMFEDERETQDSEAEVAPARVSA